MPYKIEGKTAILKCTRCGYEVKIDRNKTRDYRIRFQVEANKRTVTSKAIEARRLGLTPEEREMLREYYEVFLESFQEEEGGEE